MSIPGRNINPTISVDCVIFGFSTNQLKVLLIERNYTDRSGIEFNDHKLPGDFISIDEDLDLAASRTLEELTGLRDIFLSQFAVFGKPDRISNQVDMEWLLDTTGLEIHRVVTAAYYSFINIGETNTDFAIKNNASWIDVKHVPDLAFDHSDIIQEGLKHLQFSLRSEPIGFEMLPEKFTIRELQTLYEVILGCTLDNRNFRKKILKSSYLVQLDEKQTGVAHKPAYYYRFDRNIYEEHKKESLGYNF
ncbi:MAG: NUDIX hydrolase, partial [Bacteroidales bacterium]|nr:NUDIX hydrolase [Bacteroidales bacterium]